MSNFILSNNCCFNINNSTQKYIKFLMVTILSRSILLITDFLLIFKNIYKLNLFTQGRRALRHNITLYRLFFARAEQKLILFVSLQSWDQHWLTAFGKSVSDKPLIRSVILAVSSSFISSLLTRRHTISSMSTHSETIKQIFIEED